MLKMIPLRVLIVLLYFVFTVQSVYGGLIKPEDKDTKQDDLVILNDAEKQKIVFSNWNTQRNEDSKDPATMWFASKLGKLTKRSLDSTNSLVQEEFPESIMDQYNNIYQTIPAVNEPDNMRFDLTQGSPWIVYLLAGKLRKTASLPTKFLTPRLGRDPGDHEVGHRVAGNRPPFAPRLGRSNLFSPRLGRQAIDDY